MFALKVIIGILVIIGIANIWAIKTGKVKDEDGDFIPDELEKRAKRLKEESKDVIDAVKEVGNQLKDLPSAAKGETRKGRKPNK